MGTVPPDELLRSTGHGAVLHMPWPSLWPPVSPWHVLRAAKGGEVGKSGARTIWKCLVYRCLCDRGGRGGHWCANYGNGWFIVGLRSDE